MRIAKPHVRRVYITAVDPATGTSKATTIYGTSPREFVAWLKSQIDPGAAAPRKRRHAAKATAAIGAGSD
jgi:hypothetical protein